jgi:hypothetical protein
MISNLRLADINTHREQITTQRVILTHMSNGVLDKAPDTDGNPCEQRAVLSLTFRTFH